MPLVELAVHQVIPVTIHCTSLHLHLRNTVRAVTFPPLQKLEKLLYTVFLWSFFSTQDINYRQSSQFSHEPLTARFWRNLHPKKIKFRKVKTQSSSFHYAATENAGELGLAGISSHLPSDQTAQTETGRFSGIRTQTKHKLHTPRFFKAATTM